MVEAASGVTLELRPRSSPFSYECRGCGRCCHRKWIAVNPYEIARLADGLGTSTTDVIDRYLMDDGATLRTVKDGACVFLREGACSVHADRPLVCRLYPLGWTVAADGGELFMELRPHPQTEGVYGGDGTIGDYLDAQGTAPYERAARGYVAVMQRMRVAAEAPGPEPGLSPPLTDVDEAVTADSAARGVPVPRELEARVARHLDLLAAWVDAVAPQT